MDTSAKPRATSDYTVAYICPMGVELAPVKAMLDHIHPDLPTLRDQNSYILGDVAGHNVVIAVLPEVGTNAAASVAIQLLNDFHSIRFGLLVGIGGGVPDDEDEEDGNNIRLGDVVVSKPTQTFGGVVQFDLGKHITGGEFERTGQLNKPPALLRSKVEQLAADHRIQGTKIPLYLSQMIEKYPAMQDDSSCPGIQHDLLFRMTYAHTGGRTCQGCDRNQLLERETRRNQFPKIHYGTIGSSNSLVKDAMVREQLRKGLQIICLEMEAAGLMNDFPCLVIRGICDYADSHKNKKWQPYAAAVAAAYAKELLSIIPPKDTSGLAPAVNVVQVSDYDRGLNLFDAPDIDQFYFVGREDELERIRASLATARDSSERKIVVLGGMGGVGKTQLAISYAKKHRDLYSSIFWLDAASETTLKSSLRLLASRIAPESSMNNVTDDNLILSAVLNWLSKLENTGWLLIYDNYDDPEQYKISRYYPYVAHGSIIITSRLPDKVGGRPLHLPVRSFQSIDDSLEILSRRSEREGVHNDIHACKLAERLAGLPLALATAGAFLHRRKSTWSFEQYLRVYEEQWHIDPIRPIQLGEYENRTLYTTWNISYTQLNEHDPAAAKLLKLFAYFDNKSLWYELLCCPQSEHSSTRSGGIEGDINEFSNCADDIPHWLSQSVLSPASFEGIMRVLVDYCFVEVQSTTQTYGLHNCVHDWSLIDLNNELDPKSYWYAFDRVSAAVQRDDLTVLGYVNYAPLTQHAMRLVHNKFEKVGLKIPKQRLGEAAYIALLLTEQLQFDAGQTVYLRTLAGRELAFGSEHDSTLEIFNDLGTLYSNQGKLDQAEQLYLRALAGYEKTYGPDDPKTLVIVHNLGVLCYNQGKVDQAEQLFLRALTGCEKKYGPEHTKTLAIVLSLGNLYYEQGKLDLAELLYLRALAGYEKTYGPDDPKTLDIVYNLGLIQFKQGKLEQAEQLYLRALTGYEKMYGLDHTETLEVVHNLGLVQFRQGKLEQVEQLYLRAFTGYEKTYGVEHTATLDVIQNLGCLYRQQGKLEQAEQLHLQVLAGREKIHGSEHK